MATTMTLKPVSKSGAAKGDILLVELNWLSTTGGASTTSTAQFYFMEKPISYYLQGRELVMAETSPGAVTPTALYDITVANDDTQDLFGGNLADRSATLAESSYTYDTAVYGTRYIDGDLTITVANAGNAKTGKLTLTFE